MKAFEQYTDIEIIQKILEREFALFEILIRRNNSCLYKTGRCYNMNHEDTQDLMQDTFIDAYTSLNKFENRASLTNQIAEALKEALQSDDVAIIIDAAHLCVSSRGIKDTSSSTVTASYSGRFLHEKVKAEFLSLLKI